MNKAVDAVYRQRPCQPRILKLAHADPVVSSLNRISTVRCELVHKRRQKILPVTTIMPDLKPVIAVAGSAPCLAAPVMRGHQRSRPMRGRVFSSALAFFAAYVFVRSLPDIKRYMRMRQM